MLGAGFAMDRENKPKPGRHFFLHQRNDDPSIQYRGDFVASFQTRTLTGLALVVSSCSSKIDLQISMPEKQFFLRS